MKKKKEKKKKKKLKKKKKKKKKKKIYQTPCVKHSIVSYLHFILLLFFFFFFFMFFSNHIQLRNEGVFQIIGATNRNPMQTVNPTGNPDPERVPLFHLHAHHRLDPLSRNPRSMHCHVIIIVRSFIHSKSNQQMKRNKRREG